jgi:ADP-ribosylglycohydrolase
MTTTTNQLTRYWGCLYGVALGDAIGAPVEFHGWESIKAKYGPRGVPGLVANDSGPCSGLPPGYYTDDTQMTIATAQGLIECHADVLKADPHIDLEQCDPTEHIWDAYLAWYDLQHQPGQSRGPGGTCMSALASSLRDWRFGTVEDHINNSKGCGGVMRTAPCGLVTTSPSCAFWLGAAAAAITHGHPDGYIPAGALAAIICGLTRGWSLDFCIKKAMILAETYEGHESTVRLLDMARTLAYRKGHDIRPRAAFKAMSSVEGRPGGGWVGDEALAIAVYSCLRHQDDWKAAVLEAVNHDGDSDSTGSIAGGILGTLLGHTAIPPEWVDQVENRDYLRNDIAGGLHGVLHRA